MCARAARGEGARVAQVRGKLDGGRACRSEHRTPKSLLGAGWARVKRNVDLILGGGGERVRVGSGTRLKHAGRGPIACTVNVVPCREMIAQWLAQARKKVSTMAHLQGPHMQRQQEDKGEFIHTC